MPQISLKRTRMVVFFLMAMALGLMFRIYGMMHIDFSSLSTSSHQSVSASIGNQNQPLLPLDVLLDRQFQPLADWQPCSYPLLQSAYTAEEISHELALNYVDEEWQFFGETMLWRRNLTEAQWLQLRQLDQTRLRPIYLAETQRIWASHLSGLGGAGLIDDEAETRWQNLLWNWFDRDNEEPPFSAASAQSAEQYYFVTTLRKDLQQIVEKIAAEDVPRGGIIVMNAQGEILAAVSRPAVDAKDITSSPYLNRVFASYPPGSLFKLLLAGIALDEKIIDTDTVFFCPGYHQLPDRQLACTGQHGWLDIYGAIAHSCNAVFGEIGERIGYQRLREAIEKLHLNSAHGLPISDLPQTSPDILSESVTPGELANISIGQGQLLATPLDMALLYATVANGGVMPQPSLLRGRISVNRVFSPQEMASYEERLWSDQTNQVLLEALRLVVESGTGHYAANDQVQVAGKSGTAELGSDDRNHAWFASLAPADDPQIIVIVFIEEGQWGGAVAGPVTKKVLEEVFRVLAK